VSGAQTIGEGELSITVNLPADYDRQNGKVTTVVAKLMKVSDSSEVNLKIFDSTDNLKSIVDSASIQVPFDKGASNMAGIALKVRVTVQYGTVEKVATKDNLKYGPPALATFPTVTATGRKNLLIKYATSTEWNAATISNYPSIKYRIVFKNPSDTVVKTLPDMVFSDFAHVTTVPTEVTGLSEDTVYTVHITSVVDTGVGGTAAAGSFKTGYDAPIVGEEVLDSTSNKITVTLPNGSTFTGKLTVKIKGNSHDLDFVSGVASKTLTGLAAEQAYSWSVVVMTASGVSSGATQISFTQGPTEPTFQTPVKTHNSITFKWADVTQNTYYITILKEDGSAVANHPAEISTDQGSFLFTGLEQGTSYKLLAKAKMVVNNKDMYSGTKTSSAVKTYDCAVSSKTDLSLVLLRRSGAADAPGDEVQAEYLYADSNTRFWVQCAANYSYDLTDLSPDVDNVTACIGPNEWEAHSFCIPQEERSTDTQTKGNSSAGLVVGIIVAVVVILIIIIVVIVLIRRKSSRKGSECRKKYSPRDEEKNNDKVEGGEAWSNPYYQDTNEKGSPDIPDNREANGDTASQDVERR